MSNQKKFGAFAGVFTPSLLTILGVIMYMRLGWVVGNAGLIGTIIIIVIAHVISITTGLSIASIATDKKVGAGGVYYVLSRSLGLPIGGAIGVTLFVGTAMSIALYLIGFAESFNPYFGFESDINGLRIVGSLALLALTIMAVVSTSLALKAQFFILAAIIISLVSIFVGVSPQLPEVLHVLPADDGISMETIFAIFFPAVTGFTAGIAMSGDLKDPKKSIPSGTLWAIGVGFVVYIVLAIFIFYSVDAELLKTDNNILLKLAMFAPAVVAGIWGATLSSALGGILGGPRILQAMSVDKITPKLFSFGVGKGNEPRNALFLTVLIAEAGILIGELDVIARVCSMFYLAAYGFINLSFFLESWASTDFNPTFKVKKWIGLVGFIATFVVMFRLDMVAMIAAFAVIGGIYFWLARKQLTLGSGDVWQSVWSSVVKKGLHKMDNKQDHKRNWKPNVLLFSGGTDQRPYLLEFGKQLVGKRGIVTNFDLHENKKARLLFPKHQQRVNDEILKEDGVFGRKVEVNNIFKGIEAIASTFGFSGIEPNTVLMGWAKNTSDPIWFTHMTQRLIDLDFNVLYLDYDWRYGFRKYTYIDLWWRDIGNNAELMLNISKFLLTSDLWRDAQIRVLIVNQSNENQRIIEKKVQHILEEYRITASLKIISNATMNRPIYELMKIYSSEADLILLGIPEIKKDEAKNFVSQTNDLVGTIGTTLLVKASSRFDEVQFITPEIDYTTSAADEKPIKQEVPELDIIDDKVLKTAIEKMRSELDINFENLVESVFGPLQEKYVEVHQLIRKEITSINSSRHSEKGIRIAFGALLQKLQTILEHVREIELPVIGELFLEEQKTVLEKIEEIINTAPKKLKLNQGPKGRNVPYKTTAKKLKKAVFVPALNKVYSDFGNNVNKNLSETVNYTVSKTYATFDLNRFSENYPTSEEIATTIEEMLDLISTQTQFFGNLKERMSFELRSVNQEFLRRLVEFTLDSKRGEKLKELISKSKNREIKKFEENNISFPGNWLNNQTSIHTSLETNLELAQVNLMVNEGIRKMMTVLDNEVNQKIQEQFLNHTITMKKVVKEFDSKKEIKSLENFEISEGSLIGIEPLMQLINNDETRSVASLANETVLLLGKPLWEDFSTQQFEGILPIALDLSKVVDYILETNLISPLHGFVQAYLADVSNLYYNQVNRINLLKYALTEGKDLSEKEELLQSVVLKLESEKETYETLKIRFQEQVRSIMQNLQMELDSRFLVENGENWSRYISEAKREKGISMIKNRVKSKISKLYSGINATVIKKKNESESSVFESKYNLSSNLELGLTFVNSISLKADIAADLPFYYKQLFLGKQLVNQQDFTGREREWAKFEETIIEGRSSVVLVLGKSGSGKTHFCEHLATSQQKTKKIFRIDPLGKQGSLKELQQLILKSTGGSGTIEQCFQQLPKKSTIIISDIEVWWNRFVEKDALSYIIELIDKFSKSHQFILSANLYAMEAFSKQRPIQKIITSSIILSPMSKDDLKAIILERHKLGGLDFEYKGEHNNYEGTNFNRLIGKIHNESKGNIGLGLQLWLKNIVSYTDDTISMSDEISRAKLRFNDTKWKWLLYQFIINRHLSKKNLKEMFDGDDYDIEEIIGGLLKSTMVEQISANIYAINGRVKPHIENWLLEQSILN
jgi:amino acid transporter